MFVGDQTLSFFIEVAEVMCYSELSDGSVLKDTVLANVTSSPSLLAMWGSLIGNALPETESMYLMRLLVLSLCTTFGNGIVLRRMNKAAADKQGQVTGVALRSQVAR